MRILVTGGGGFLGSHLVDKLLLEGNDVICLDNFFTGNIKNISNFMDLPNFELIEHDVTVPIDLNVDQIYNFACPASPIHYQKDPIRTTRTNLLGAINMLELAQKNNARILQASTSEVYGDPEVHPQVEDYWGRVNPIGIRSCYDEGKRCAETLFFDWNRQHDLSIKVVRIFNTYGPKMHPKDGRVISNFIVQALKGEPITIYGDGSQTRSFCFVEDLIDGIIKFMATDKEITGPVNLGNPEEYQITEIAQTIINLTNSASDIVYEQLPLDDPRQRKPDISLANKLVGFSPKIGLEDGLKRTISYFKENTE
jgi:UDP-glucuronate decarboxylase